MSDRTPDIGTAIEVSGARTHNLKGISCRIPHRCVTVVTGPSGAGKSSLAFDTVYAEGQRRFVESMSTYARQFLDQMERPPVESVTHVLPSVALEAKNAVRNARSTVGTITEVHDILRLLFTHLGEVYCPRGHGPGRRTTAEEAADELAEGVLGSRITLVVRLPRPKRRAEVALQELVRQGYGRRLEDGEVVRMSPDAPWPRELDPLPLVLGRFSCTSVSRLTAALEEGIALGPGLVEARGAEGVRFVGRGVHCPHCGAAMSTPVPALFSFNSPLGACSTCQGFGRVIGVDRDRVVPDPRRSLEERPIAPWNTPAYEELYDGLYAACRKRGVPLDVPWDELADEHRSFVWSGSGFTNLERFFAWLERRSYKVHVRVLLARYRAYTPCPDCAGARLKPEALRVRLLGETVPELERRSVEALLAWLDEQRFTPRQRERSGHLLDQLHERLSVLARVGLGYLTLDRQARTLSGGETQRIHLAAALGSGLTDTLYVLDEPTVGLHPRDSGALLGLLRELALRGNTVLVVEHDPTLIRGADWIIDLGPAAGEHGGRVVSEGPLETVLESDSLTARYLPRRPSLEARRHAARAQRERASGGETNGKVIRIVGARAHNLRGLDVSFPFHALVAVTGVSGSGKSTLVETVLYGNAQRRRGAVDVEVGACEAIEGVDELADVVLVDQQPLGRSSRSNPVTYVKAYDEIRKLYASLPEAQRQGITPAHFSFNLDKGRCPECQGTGEVEVDMHFMAAVTVTCDACQGRRFLPRVLAVRCEGRTIAETLDLTVSEALEVFRERQSLCRRLAPLVDVGLGYLRLGQTTATLSGGEAQRLKLATFLGRGGSRRRSEGRRLFLFDEPTTGLHLSDIDLLHQTLRRLVGGGHGVVVVEHNLELVSCADWIIDLGPGGGEHGGRLLYSGPIAGFLDRVDSPTAQELRAHFGDG